MWEVLGLSIGDLEKRPGRGESVAARFRQLLRAYEAEDVIAVWTATSSFAVSLRLLLEELLSCEPSWDRRGRWFEGLATHRFLFRTPNRIRASCPMVWGLRSNVGGRLWAEPYQADLELTPDWSDLASYTIRFGDRRGFPEEDFQCSLSRITTEIESGEIEWAFVFRKGHTCPPGPK